MLLVYNLITLLLQYCMRVMCGSRFTFDCNLVHLRGHKLVVTLAGVVIHLPLTQECFHLGYLKRRWVPKLPNKCLMSSKVCPSIHSIVPLSHIVVQNCYISILYSAVETLMLVSILYSCWAKALPKTRGCLAFEGDPVNTMAFYKGALFAPKHHYIIHA